MLRPEHEDVVVTGDSGHMAARANAALVLMSRKLLMNSSGAQGADLTAGSGLVFEDAGEHELKGVPDTWRLYRVIA